MRKRKKMALWRAIHVAVFLAPFLDSWRRLSQSLVVEGFLFGIPKIIPKFRSNDLRKKQSTQDLRCIQRHSSAGCLQNTKNNVNQHQNDEPNQNKYQFLDEDQIYAIDSVLEERARARLFGNYGLADDILNRLITTYQNNNPINDDDDEEDDSISSFVPPGYQILIRDLPRNVGGGSLWDIVPVGAFPMDGDDDVLQTGASSSILGLARAALGLVMDASERQVCVDWNQIETLVNVTKHRLNRFGSAELRGRKAADAAFYFALAGVNSELDNQRTYQNIEAILAGVNKTQCSQNSQKQQSTRDHDEKHSVILRSKENASFLDHLVEIATDELKRFGMRKSCRIKDILHIVERIAASGVTGRTVNQLYQVAADCIEYKTAPGTLTGDFLGGGVGNKNIRNDSFKSLVALLRGGSFGLHSESSLMWLWRFSARQRRLTPIFVAEGRRWLKEQVNRNCAHETVHSYCEQTNKNDPTSLPSPVSTGSLHGDSISSSEDCQYDWSSMFADPTAPLVVDIGCGMGVSILGLATWNKENDINWDENNSAANINLDWATCNYIGVDTNCLSIGYANGIASRWNLLHGRVFFRIDRAEQFLERLEQTYPGDVALILIQFPTPFRLVRREDDEEAGKDGSDFEITAMNDFSMEDEIIGDVVMEEDDVNRLDYDDLHTKPSSQHQEQQRGNSRLPLNVHSGFMVNPNVLRLARRALEHNGGGRGKLLIQSNCEDVAVTMLALARSIGLEPMSVPHCVIHSNNDDDDRTQSRMPKRTLEWISMGGSRAEGPMWSSVPFLPERAATETEVSCLFHGTPIHRICFMTPSSTSNDTIKW